MWDAAHPTRRAGVLIVLTPSGPDDLEVLLEVRTQQLSYAGDAALPGGKADTPEESPLDTALREAREEVALDSNSVEYLNTMPGYVSSKLLMVVPSIVWAPKPVDVSVFSKDEVHKIFRMPLSRFLSTEGHSTQEGVLSSSARIKLDYFDVLAAEKRVGDPKYDRVWGLTANILVDCAQVVFNRPPDFDLGRWTADETGEKVPTVGNMKILEKLEANGTLASEYKRHKI